MSEHVELSEPANKDGIRLIDCESCGFVHVDPIPRPELLTRYYGRTFWQNVKPDALDALRRQRKWWRATYGDWLTLLGDAHDGRLVDVGCGYGEFAQVASAWGWTVVGIEPSERAAAYCERRGLHIYAETWETCRVMSADAVSALWLIEHLPDPAAFLKWCNDILWPGGKLLLVLPNEWTPIQEEANLFATKHEWWVHASHINYFSWASIEALLERCGFRITERFATYPMERFVMTGADYTDDHKAGRKAHKHIEKMDLLMSRESRISYYRWLGRRGRGRDIVLVAEKAPEMPLDGHRMAQDGRE